jgi:hypothetical protein
MMALYQSAGKATLTTTLDATPPAETTQALAKVFLEADTGGQTSAASITLAALHWTDVPVWKVYIVEARYMATCKGLRFRTCQHTTAILRQLCSSLVRGKATCREHCVGDFVRALEFVRAAPSVWTVASAEFWLDSIRPGRVVEVGWSSGCQVEVGTGGFRLVAQEESFHKLASCFRLSLLCCTPVLPPFFSEDTFIPERPGWMQAVVRTSFPVIYDVVVVATLVYTLHLFGRSESLFVDEPPSVNVCGTDDAPRTELEFATVTSSFPCTKLDFELALSLVPHLAISLADEAGSLTGAITWDSLNRLLDAADDDAAKTTVLRVLLCVLATTRGRWVPPKKFLTMLTDFMSPGSAPEVAVQAVKVLGALAVRQPTVYGTLPALGALINAVAEGDSDVQESALQVLFDVAKAHPGVLASLHPARPEERLVSAVLQDVDRPTERSYQIALWLLGILSPCCLGSLRSMPLLARKLALLAHPSSPNCVIQSNARYLLEAVVGDVDVAEERARTQGPVAALDFLPVFPAAALGAQKEAEFLCTICLDRGGMVVLLPCGHVFHQCCIQRAAKGSVSAACLVCRADFVEGVCQAMGCKKSNLLFGVWPVVSSGFHVVHTHKKVPLARIIQLGQSTRYGFANKNAPQKHGAYKTAATCPPPRWCSPSSSRVPLSGTVSCQVLTRRRAAEGKMRYGCAHVCTRARVRWQFGSVPACAINHLEPWCGLSCAAQGHPRTNLQAARTG